MSLLNVENFDKYDYKIKIKIINHKSIFFSQHINHVL